MTRRFLLALILALLCSAVPAGSDAAQPVAEWPFYGADLANTRTVPGGPSTTQAAALSVAWRADFTDGDFTGTPVVKDGVAYVGSNGGVVRAIQAVPTTAHKAGAVLWKIKIGAPVNGTLAAAGERVFVPVAKVGGPSILALDARSGRKLWSTVLDRSTQADVYGSPTVASRLGNPVVLQGVSAVSGDPDSPLRGSLSAIDAASGHVAWKTYAVPKGFNGGAIWSTPAVDGNSVYAGTGNAYSGTAADTTDAIVRFDLVSGKILGSYQATPNDVFSSDTPGLDFDFGASPNLVTVAGHHYVGEGQKSGTYWLLDTTTMKPVWHTQIGTASVLGGILGSTAFDAASGHIVGPNSVPGYAWSLAPADGTPQWVTAGVGDPAHLSPTAISNGVVYSVTSSGFLIAWDESTGVPLGQFALTDTPETTLASGVAIADGLVIAVTGSGGSNGSVVAFGPA